MNVPEQRIVAGVAAAFALAGCKGVPVPDMPGVTPYRIEIQQGNFVSQDMVAKLKPGMSREQVRFILGTPLVTDIFHSDRWDYVYWRELPGKTRERRQLAVYFEQGRLKRVNGDVVPAAPKPEAPAAKPAPKPAAASLRQGPQETPIAPGAAPAGDTAAKEPAAADKTAREAGAAAPETEQGAQAPAQEAPSERGFFGRLLEKIGL